MTPEIYSRAMLPVFFYLLWVALFGQQTWLISGPEQGYNDDGSVFNIPRPICVTGDEAGCQRTLFMRVVITAGEILMQL
jgi:hypothetical protein